MNENTKFLDSVERSIGLVYLTRYPSQGSADGWIYNVHVDGALLMSSVAPLSERVLATSAIAAHKGNGKLRILIGGLGLGYTGQAALESPRASVVRVVDCMDFVISWLRKGLLPLSEQLTTDERMEFVLSDIYGDLLAPPSETWDIILVDVDHSPDLPLDPASLDFYTVDGQQRVRKHLAPGGVLAVWSATDNDPFADVLAQTYSESWREEVAWTVKQEGETDQQLHNVLFFGYNA